MMTRIQYLLSKLAEEANEVAQIALKTQQFGANEVQPGQQYTNKQRTHLELDDLLAIINMLNEECGFDFDPSQEHVDTKKEKVNHYCNLAVSLGQVEGELKKGDSVWVYDRYRFSIALKAVVHQFSDSNDGVRVTLCTSNNVNYPSGSSVWVHKNQLKARAIR